MCHGKAQIVPQHGTIKTYVPREGTKCATGRHKISDGDFGKYFHLPVSVNFGKWILFTGKLPVNKKNQLTL
jgi:hypothetical protein